MSELPGMWEEADLVGGWADTMSGETETRTLYVGDHVSWDAQWSRAVKLYGDGVSVTIHDHAPDDRCRLDGARCKCGTLTDGGDGPTLDLFTSNEVDN